MKMTTLGITKEEMIYQFIISLNKGGGANNAYAEQIVEEAIDEYNALIENDIIKEIACVEPGKSADNPHSLEDHEGMVWDLNIGEYVYPENLPSHWHYTEEEE